MWTQRPLLVKDFLGAIVPMGTRYYLIITLLLFWLYSVIRSFGINVLQYECWTGLLCYLYSGKSGWVSAHLHMLVCFTGSWVFILTCHMITAFSNHSFYFCPRSGCKSLPFNDWVDSCWSSFCIWSDLTEANWPLRDEPYIFLSPCSKFSFQPLLHSCSFPSIFILGCCVVLGTLSLGFLLDAW